jgi:hypothetical protein
MNDRRKGKIARLLLKIREVRYRKAMKISDCRIFKVLD